jgi:CubicO group peptidase (beta-lactamase class C family)
MKYFKIIFVSMLASAAWAGLALYGGLSGWWLDAIAEPGDSQAFMGAAVSMVDNSSPGSVAFTLIENGEVYDSHYIGSDRSVDGDTLFPAASLSKWPAAYGVMLLVQQGKVELDAPVSKYLTRWQLPESEFDNEQVTVGRLLSHTAGLTDELGFGDYAADETLPGLEESLSNPRDSDGADVRIAIGREPGSNWGYSGGGYLILELLVEEVSGQDFAEYMQQAVFDPLGMTRSNYAYLAGQDNIAGSFERSGEAAPLYKYAAKSATGLSTTTNDMVSFALAHIGDAAPLSADQIALMREPHGYKMGMAIWGQGVMLHSPNGEGDYVFGHDGANDPSINASVRIDPASGDGIVALSTGPAYLASRIAYQWGLWKTGYPDFIQSGLAIDSAIRPIQIGILLIAALAIVLLLRLSRQ